MVWIYFFLGVAIFGLLFWLTEAVERWERWN